MATKNVTIPASIQRIQSVLSQALTFNKHTKYLRLLHSCIVHYLFKKIHQSFMEKAEGKADDYGEEWEPLSPATIARRSIGKNVKGYRRGARRPFLTASQDREWKRTYYRYLKTFERHHDLPTAKIRAARVAWTHVKQQGGKTRKEYNAQRSDILINIRTRRLERSLRPGRINGTSYSPPSEQRYESTPQGFEAGTEVPYASYVDERRPITPSQRTMENIIIPEALEFAASKLSEQLEQDLRNLRR